MTEEVQENLPIEEAAPPVATETEAPAPAEAVEAAPEAKPEQEPESKKQPWFLQRISEESAKARQAAERAEHAERRAREAEELLKRFNQSTGEHRTETAPRPIDPNQDEIDRRANQLIFQRDVNDLNAAGMRAFGADFNTKVDILAHVIGHGDPLFEFANDVMSVDKANAHAILHHLGSNPDEAAVLAHMNSKQRLVALARMSMSSSTEEKPAAAAAPTKQVSKAPAPAPSLQPTTHKIINWQSPEADKLSDKEFFEAMDNDPKYKARMLHR